MRSSIINNDYPFVVASPHKRASLFPLSLFSFETSIVSHRQFYHTLNQFCIQIGKEMYSIQQEGVQSAENLRQYSYVRTMGGYRPHFQGIPEEYYPLTCCEAIAYSIFVVAIIGGSLGLMIGFLFWVTNRGLVDYTIAWSIIFLVFVVLLIVAFYAGGRNRIREEKRLIAEEQQKQQRMKGKSKKKAAAHVDQIDI